MPAGPSSLIVTALVRRATQLLLVEQQGPWDPEPAWMLPGGRVEPNETLLAALMRELTEETGLTVGGLPLIAFAVEVQIDSGRYSAITFDCQTDGVVAPNDPDGFVRGARWMPLEEAVTRLRLVEWYDCVPLERYLSGEAPPGTVYRSGHA